VFNSNTGNASVIFTCDPASVHGCTIGGSVKCFQSTGCVENKFTKSSGTASFATNTRGGISYGPLIHGSCFSVKLNFTGSLSGINIQLTPGQTVNALSSDIIVISGCMSDPTPLIANFNYRVLCNPIEKDLPVDRFRIVDDLVLQMSFNPPQTLAELSHTNKAYFTLNPVNSSSWSDVKGEYELLDELMEKIPGLDNFNSELTESIAGELSYHYTNTNEPLNAAYYSRFYSLKKPDAMGHTKRRRSFNDFNLFSARTTQDLVASLGMPDPTTGEIIRYKYSYAIPLEIIYLTPLSSWNPYDLPSEGGNQGRTGGLTQTTAFASASPNEYFYWTPAEFFEADSTATVGVIDKNGVIQRVRASGVYTFLPTVAGESDHIRLRYPITPVAWNKNPGFMNAKALKHMYTEDQADNLVTSDLHLLTAIETLYTGRSTTAGAHFHRIDVPGSIVDGWNKNATAILTVTTEKEQGHSHALKISRTKVPNGFTYTIVDCDAKGKACADGHSTICLNDQQGGKTTCIQSP